MFELSLAKCLAVAVIAFGCEYMDSTLGMGYGTTLTPVLMLLGFQPIFIVPAVLSSELVSGLLAGVFHHWHGNVNLMPRSTRLSVVAHKVQTLGLTESFKRGTPRHLKVAILLSAIGVVGTVGAVFVAVSIPPVMLEFYIGALVLGMGATILLCRNRQFGFSWRKVSLLGLLASFNKGMSGGGYGPVVTGGQILSGVDGRSAVGITSVAEGLTCLVGVVVYGLVSGNIFAWKLTPFIMTGAILSVPLSALSVKKLDTRRLTLAIGIFTTILGTVTLGRIFLS